MYSLASRVCALAYFFPSCNGVASDRSEARADGSKALGNDEQIFLSRLSQRLLLEHRVSEGAWTGEKIFRDFFGRKGV